MAGVILESQPRIHIAQGNPNRFAAPSRVNYLVPERQQSANIAQVADAFSISMRATKTNGPAVIFILFFTNRIPDQRFAAALASR
jgi:hypothetical protein